MVCPYCSGDTDVINSRSQKRNNQVWRRRRCLKCQAVFTTHELLFLPAIYSVNKGRSKEAFLPDKLFSELVVALRHRENAYEAAREVLAPILRNVTKTASKGLISPQAISLETGAVLKRLDRQAWLRYIAEHPSLHPKRL